VVFVVTGPNGYVAGNVKRMSWRLHDDLNSGFYCALVGPFGQIEFKPNTDPNSWLTKLLVNKKKTVVISVPIFDYPDY
jgi:hypothetical protein